MQLQFEVYFVVMCELSRHMKHNVFLKIKSIAIFGSVPLVQGISRSLPWQNKLNLLLFLRPNFRLQPDNY